MTEDTQHHPDHITRGAQARGHWPDRRGDRREFVQQFGAGRAERFETAFHAGDTVADALFAEDQHRAANMRHLRRALRTGAADSDATNEVKAFIAEMRAAGENVDWERIDRGRRVYLSIPVLAHSIALGPGSLTNTYSSPAIASVLTATGRLVEGALRRLTDTRNWTYHLYFADALRPGGGGFEHTGMVRAMHAFSRRKHAELGAGTADFGVPINEIDMLRTWFDFTYVPYRGLHAMGYELTEDQVRDVYYFWQVIGRMLGIPHDLLEGLSDHDSAEETARAIRFVSGSPDENSRALVNALVDAVATQMAIVLEVPKEPLVERNQAFIRLIHGDELADELQVPRRSVQVSEALQVPMVSQRFAFLQQLPVEHEKEIATNLAIIEQLLNATNDGRSAYETAPAA